MSEKELKLIIAGQCMASLLYKNTGYQMTGSIKPRGQAVKRQYEEIALKSWEAATELMALSKKEEIKPEPIVFEAIVRQDMPFAYLSNVPDGIPLGTKFKCVEILEEN